MHGKRQPTNKHHLHRRAEIRTPCVRTDSHVCVRRCSSFVGHGRVPAGDHRVARFKADCNVSGSDSCANFEMSKARKLAFSLSPPSVRAGEERTAKKIPFSFFLISNRNGAPAEKQNRSVNDAGKNESDHTLLHTQTSDMHTTCVVKARATCAHKPIESHTLSSRRSALFLPKSSSSR